MRLLSGEPAAARRSLEAGWKIAEELAMAPLLERLRRLRHELEGVPSLEERRGRTGSG
jgi:hypothetical protein